MNDEKKKVKQAVALEYDLGVSTQSHSQRQGNSGGEDHREGPGEQCADPSG